MTIAEYEPKSTISILCFDFVTDRDSALRRGYRIGGSSWGGDGAIGDVLQFFVRLFALFR